MRSAAKKGPCSGFVSDYADGSEDPPLHRPAGTREALPGTIRRACAPRCCASTLNQVEDCAEIQRKNLAIGKHLPDCGDVPGADQGQLLELAHAAGALGAREMTLARMGAPDFAGRGDFETLGGAAMCFQFLFWLRGISWHCKNPLLLACGLPAHRISHTLHLAKLGRSNAAPLLRKFYAGCAACCELGFAAGAPFLGASSATRTLPSMRGMVSIWPCSPISPSKRVILARPTS
jgi:hypothetical protein